MLGSALMLVLSVLIGDANAVAMLSPALGLLLVLNLIVLCLLGFDLRAGLSRLYTRWEFFGIGAVAVGAGLLVPVCLLLLSGSSLLMLAAVMFVLLGSLFIRFVIIALPHAAG